jgi:uncharacterized protein
MIYQRWSHLTFLHWPYPPQAISPLIPDGLTVETFDGEAWVGLIPFLIEDARPAVPGLSRFLETNVRTYVRDSRGRSGVWFFSLDAASPVAVLGARAGFRLPYHWAEMSLHMEGGHRRYRSRRRPGGARADIDVEVGPPVSEAERDGLASFLVERYRLFTRVAGRQFTAEVEHIPWPLHHGELSSLDETVIEAAGLPKPGGAPVVHTSPGVETRIGRLRN